MEFFRIAMLFISAVLACFSASAQNIGWRPIQTVPLPTSVFIFQQPNIDVAPLLNELHRSEDARSRAQEREEAYIERRSNEILRESQSNSGRVPATAVELPIVSPNGTRFHQVGDTLYVTRPDGTNLVCREGVCR